MIHDHLKKRVINSRLFWPAEVSAEHAFISYLSLELAVYERKEVLSSITMSLFKTSHPSLKFSDLVLHVFLMKVNVSEISKIISFA